MSSSLLRLLALSAFAALAIAACTNDAPPSATAAPVPGDVGPTPGPSSDNASLPGPRADDPPGDDSKTRRATQKPKGDPKDSSLKLDPSKMDPTTFVPKEHCLLPKLSMCSAYGEKYERLQAVQSFCAALGGEKSSSCLEEGRVAKCMSPANVLTSYYSTGEKPYTKESAEAKCLEKEWLIVP